MWEACNYTGSRRHRALRFRAGNPSLDEGREMEIARVSTSCDHGPRLGAKDKDTERSLGAMSKGELECGSPA